MMQQVQPDAALLWPAAAEVLAAAPLQQHTVREAERQRTAEAIES